MNESGKNLPRDTFLYLLAIISLIVSAVGFGMAVFNYIDFYFPDPAVDYYRSASSYGPSIRQAMAMLIVVFPVFLWVSRFLRKDIELYPEKKELKIRKWLLYLTLFAATLVMIGDLVTVLNNFLRGELTVRFILKALTIFFISGSAFYYYLLQLREKKVSPILAWVISVIVIAAIGWGFAVVGSPFEQRAIRFDEKRIQDLSVIQNQIVSYWQSKGIMPDRLISLEDSISGFSVPRDPETGGEYEYILPAIKTGQNPIFQLCASFNKSDVTATDGGTGGASMPKPATSRGEYFHYDDNWQHEAGRYCFERSIDPELYPPVKILTPKR